jgi:transposase InsO family protein
VDDGVDHTTDSGHMHMAYGERNYRPSIPANLRELVGPVNEITVLIDRVPVRGLLDTGSMVSSVSQKFYETNLFNYPLVPLDDMITLTGASGHEVRYLGCVILPLSFPDQESGSMAEFDIPFLVVKDTAYSRDIPVLVGTNVIAKWHGYNVADYGVRFMQTRIFSTPWEWAFRSFKLSHQYDTATHLVRADIRHPLSVSSQQRLVVMGRVKAPPGPSGHVSYGSTDHHERTQLARGFSLEPSFAEIKSKGNVWAQVPVSILNTSATTLTIKPQDILCGLEVSQAMPEPDVSHRAAGVDIPEFLNKFPKSSDLSVHQQAQVDTLLSGWTSVFSHSSHDIGLCTLEEATIPLTDNTPFKERFRRIPPGMYDEVREWLSDMLTAGVIRESYSPWASAVVLVRKKDGSLRITSDLRRLNSITIRDSFAIPRISDTLESLQGNTWYALMDLKSGYYNMAIKEEDRAKTAFTLGPLGFYEYSRLVMGLKSAPSQFQRLMSKVLGNLHLSECLIYLDDVVVFGKTFDEVLERVERVFSRFHQYGMKLRPSKCHLFKRKINYLGHVVSEQGIEVDPGKIASVKEWAVPTNAHQLRVFLGLTGYFRKYIKSYAQITEPLYALLTGPNSTRHVRKKWQPHTTRPNLTQIPWEWTPSCQDAFDVLKDKLVNAPILQYADFSHPFIVQCDAAQSGLGAVLYQEIDGDERVIAYASRSLSKTERRYPTHKQEFLALKWAVADKFKEYLYQAKFVVRTDNNPLTYVLKGAKLDATSHRWLADLMSYDFTIQYRPGRKMGDADSLSRSIHTDFYHSQDEEDVNDLRAMCEARLEPVILSCGITSAAVPDMLAVPPTVPDIAMSPGLDPQLNAKIWVDRQSLDPCISKVRSYLLAGCKPTERQRSRESPGVRRYLREWKRLYLSDGVVFRRRVTPLSITPSRQLLLPQCYHSWALMGLHDHVAHQGLDRTLALVRDRYYWPGMQADVAHKVKTCDRCIRRKTPPDAHKRVPLISIPATAPLELVSVDYLSLERSTGGFTDILVITDHFTRYAIAIPTKGQTAKTTADKLFTHFICHYGFPARLHSDQGRQFESKIIQELCKLAGVSKSRTTSYHPQGNGMTERFNHTLLNMLGTLRQDQKAKWHDYVLPVTHAYNCTRHSATTYSPYELMFGRQPLLAVDVYLGLQSPGGTQADYVQYVKDLRAKLDYTYKLATANATKTATRDARYYDQGARESRLQVGDLVLVKVVAFTGKHKLSDRWEPEVYRIIDIPIPNSPVYKVQRHSGTGRTRVLHRNLLLPYCGLPVESPRIQIPDPIKPTKVVPSKSVTPQPMLDSCSVRSEDNETSDGLVTTRVEDTRDDLDIATCVKCGYGTTSARAPSRPLTVRIADFTDVSPISSSESALSMSVNDVHNDVDMSTTADDELSVSVAEGITSSSPVDAVMTESATSTHSLADLSSFSAGEIKGGSVSLESFGTPTSDAMSSSPGVPSPGIDTVCTGSASVGSTGARSQSCSTADSPGLSESGNSHGLISGVALFSAESAQVTNSTSDLPDSVVMSSSPDIISQTVCMTTDHSVSPSTAPKVSTVRRSRRIRHPPDRYSPVMFVHAADVPSSMSLGEASSDSDVHHDAYNYDACSEDSDFERSAWPTWP